MMDDHTAAQALGALSQVHRLMAFRALGGQFTGRDREGVASAAMFWYVTIAVYAVIWYSIFITK